MTSYDKFRAAVQANGGLVAKALEALPKADYSYAEFRRLVAENGWTLAQVRFDERPTVELIEAAEQFGTSWDRHVRRMERETQ